MHCRLGIEGVDWEWGVRLGATQLPLGREGMELVG
jgi:hypothetical protein